MKRNSTILFSFAALLMAAFTFTSCGKDKACVGHEGFLQDTTGFCYQFYVENPKATAVKEGDLLDVIHTLWAGDSILINHEAMPLLVNAPLYKGDFYTALTRLHVGDSARFILNLDTFMRYYFGMENFLPELKERDAILEIKVNKIMSQADFEKQQAERQTAMQAEMETRRLSEDSLRAAYLKANNITVSPTPSELYYVETKAGTGKRAENGKVCTVHYTGKLLDGTVFDSSIERNQPIVLQLGQGMVIPGWEEGIAKMREGGKATLIIPSDLAYGPNGAGDLIPPYSTLVFDVELVKVEDAPAAAAAPQQ